MSLRHASNKNEHVTIVKQETLKEDRKDRTR